MSTPLPNPTPSNSTPQLSNAWYNRLKLAALLLLPLIGALYVGLDTIWGLPHAKEVTGTIVVVETFVGGFVKVMQMLYNASSSNYDGLFYAEENADGGTNLRFGGVDQHALNTKSELVFKIIDKPFQPLA